jgi:hypothetical protein
LMGGIDGRLQPIAFRGAMNGLGESGGERVG